MKPNSINHIALKVPNPESSETFFRDTLGAERFGTLGDMIFMMLGETDLTLEKSDSLSTLSHLGFTVPTNKDVDDLYEKLLPQNIEILQKPIQRTDAYALIFRCPDGFVYEAFCNNSQVYPEFIKQEDTFFWYRNGPAKGKGSFCNKKLCFAATDLAFLIELLNWLVAFEDCVFVKFSEKARDGVYLGRCFFSNEKRVGKIWAKFKLHPKVHCNIQDDDFSENYREAVQRWENRNALDFD